MYKDEIPLGRAKDLTKQKFHRLTPLYRVANQGSSTRWKCLCDCGTECIVRASSLMSGETKSCGCWNNEVRKQMMINRNLKKVQDIIGQKFNNLTALEFVGINNQSQRLVKCKCDCRKIITTTVGHLKSGHTKSCGCQKSNLISKSKIIDLTGQKFGQLTVLNFIDIKNHNAMWNCRCECGTNVEVRGAYLLNGHTQSCGCVNSSGELKIRQLLQEANIEYETEKTFDNCKLESGYLARFDFYVNDKYLIEFDGRQHFIQGTGNFDNPEKFLQTQNNDKIKNLWTIENNIPLIRIPYYYLENLKLEDLLLETSQFIYKGEKI